MEDFHVHSTYSDGSGTLEEMAEAARTLGLTRLGFADHGYAPYDPDCCMRLERTADYLADVSALKERYAGTLELFCGVEQDFYSDAPTDDFDYVIGSVHYLLLDELYVPIDYRELYLRSAADRCFGGDCLALAEEYFRTVARVYDRTRCDIIGHFDLICKLNEQSRLFDEEDPRYSAAWKAAADALLKTGKPFEINTGGMARGYRAQPYPASPILRYLADNGAVFVLTSDSHSPDAICYDFPAHRRAAEALGAKIVPFEVPKRF